MSEFLEALHSLAVLGRVGEQVVAELEDGGLLLVEGPLQREVLGFESLVRWFVGHGKNGVCFKLNYRTLGGLAF